MNTNNNYTGVSQINTNWCWVAVAVSVSNYYFNNSKYSQCNLARETLGKINSCFCSCNDIRLSCPCNQPCEIECTSKYINVQFKEINIRETNIKSTLENGDLIVFLFSNKIDKHYLVIHNYIYDNQIFKYKCYDSSENQNYFLSFNDLNKYKINKFFKTKKYNFIQKLIYSKH